jgi:subtilisin family serine protease
MVVVAASFGTSVAHADVSAPAAAGTAAAVGAASASGTTRVLIRATDTATVAAQATAAGAKHVRRLNHAATVIADVTAPAAAELGASPAVLEIAPDRVFHLADTASAQRTEFDAAQASGYSGSGATVAILDTGIDSNHPYIGSRIVAEACFSSPADGTEHSLCPNGSTSQTGTGAAESDGTPACISGTENLCAHGTHVAGIAAGNASAAPGSSGNGVAPAASIVAVQIFTRFPAETPGGSPSIAAYDSDIASGLDYVASLADAHPSWNLVAANLSLGGGLVTGTCDTDPLKASVDALVTRNIATVIAAGNDGAKAQVSSPGCISTAVTVGATDFSDTIAGFSNRSPVVDLFAPGVGVRSSIPGGIYDTYSGTSMATPQVTGALATLKAHTPAASIATLVAALSATGAPIRFTAKGVKVVRGRIDVLGALAKPAATVGIGDASLVEGTGGSKRTLYLPVSLSKPPTSATTVRYSVVTGTASTADLNSYKGATKTLTFKPGATTAQATMTKYVAISVVADSVAESNETFSVVLSSSTGGYALGRPTGTGTIIDDDSGPVATTVSVGDGSIVEGHLGKPREARIAVTLSRPAAGTVNVSYQLSAGTATAGTDFDNLGGATKVVTFAAGTTKASVSVLVYPEYRVEGTETFSVTLSNPTPGVALARSVGTGSILNDDANPA